MLSRVPGTTIPQQAARGTVTVTADGAPVNRAVVVVRLSGPRTKSVKVTTNSSGRATYTAWGLTAGRYTVVAAVQATSQLAASTSRPLRVTVQRSRWVSLLVNSGRSTKVFARENFWLRGEVLTTRGTPHARQKVAIYRDTKKGRTKVATVRTSKNGWYVWSAPKNVTGTYRARVSSARYSAKVSVRRTTGTRTLESREESLSFLLGARKADTRQAGSVTWREYTKATLIRRGSRTWVVRGPALAKMRSHGGPAGSLGAPTGDIRCGLPEGGCLQQFRTGAVYVNKKAKRRVSSAVSPTLGAADLLAVARSQVGYRESKPRQSKYNTWIKRTGPYDPWCGYFVSWLAHAGGKPGSIIKAKSFGALLDAERRRNRISRSPQVGRLAYIGYFSKGTASHVGIVTKVQGDHVWTIEGNVSAGGGMLHPRGVHLVKRHKSQVVFYANPRY